jgi:HEAT repeat protein
MYRVLRPSILVFVICVPGLALGQMTGNVDKLKADLHGQNLDAAVAAASALGSLKSKESFEGLMGALQLGAPPKLTLALLEALGLQQNKKSIQILRHFAAYRSPKVRMASINAMRNIPNKRITRILINALGDSSPMVRARAARLLGERKARRAERPLFRLLRRGDKSAAMPLGIVGGVETAKQLAELIGVLPNASVAIALGTLLKRKDFGPDPLRLEVVKAITKIPGPDATAALVEYIASVPPKQIRISKRKAEQYLEERQK